MATMTADEVLGAARLIVRAKAPYFRAMLLSLVPRPIEGMGTIGVTDRALLVYDPVFVARQTPAQTAGLLVHEILHLLHRHGSRTATHDALTWNMAADLAINPSVREMRFELPTGDDAGMFPKDKSWPEGETADQYYARLQQEQEKKSGKGGEGQPKPGPAHGQCGSCAGHALPGEPKPEPGKAPGTDQDASGTPGQGKGEEGDGGRSQAQLERAARQVAAAVKEHAKGRGSVPGGVARWADTMLEPPKVPWQSKLARLLRSSVAYRAGAVVHRYDGPSRRQAGLGYGAGIPMLPRLRQPIPRVAIVADTSGSMSAKDLGIALREAKGVLRAVGAEVTFMTCDAQVHGMTKVASVQQMAKALKGGGGTSFIPAFEALAKMSPRPEIVLTMTDGDGTMPIQAPAGMNVIWVLIGKHCVRPAWGEVVEVRD